MKCGGMRASTLGCRSVVHFSINYLCQKGQRCILNIQRHLPRAGCHVTLARAAALARSVLVGSSP